MSQPAVTVVMPLFDGRDHVGDALTSVLAQAVPDVEVIVVDDGSTDGGADVVRRMSPTTTVLSRPHRGIAAAHNQGVEHASGRYLTFLDADDVMPEGSLAARLAALERDPRLAAVFGRMAEFVTGESERAGRRRAVVDATDARMPATMLIRREALLDIGPFDLATSRWYFIDWLARLDASASTWTRIPDLVLRRRLHETNTGLAMGLDAPALLGTLRTVLRRASAADGGDAT